jgi:hypothetical protein
VTALPAANLTDNNSANSSACRQRAATAQAADLERSIPAFTKFASATEAVAPINPASGNIHAQYSGGNRHAENCAGFY